MTELQLGLLLLAVIAVIGVLIFNQWQDARQRQEAEKILRRPPVDVLLEEEKPDGVTGPTTMEDQLDALLAAEAKRLEQEGLPLEDAITVASAGTAQRSEPVFNESETAANVAAANQLTIQEKEKASAGTNNTEAPSIPALSEMLMNVRVDYPVQLELLDKTNANELVLAHRETLSRLKKPVRWFGFDEQTSTWVSMDEKNKLPVRHVLVGLQLADRHGPASETDLTVFRAAIEKLANRLMAVVDFLPLRSALAAAVELDQFCAGIDVQVGINLIPRSTALAGVKVRSLAEAAGLSQEKEGYYAYKNSEGVSLFTLNCIDGKTLSNVVSTPGLTLLLDVPRTPNSGHAFECMLEWGRQLAEALNALLVDDNRQPLTEEALAPIREQIAAYQEALEQAKIPAGSPIARRIFA